MREPHPTPAPPPSYDAAPAAAGDVESLRPRLFGIAYRMLGSVHDAEDVVQEGYLRWHQDARDAVRSPEGWLVATVTRLAIDRLRRLTTERRAYAGPWLPEPLGASAPEAADRHAELASDLSIAFLHLLERLAPDERAAFLLREVFDAGYPEIARVLGRSEAATRQVVHRARERVRGGRARVAVPPGEHARLLTRFVDAIERGDAEGVLALLAPDVTLTSDGGGEVSAARRVVRGASAVARLLVGVQRKWGPFTTRRLERVNGELAVVTYRGDRVLAVTAIAVDGGRVTGTYRVLNPRKLTRLQPRRG